jgi:ribosomal protein L11 methyltransferase
LEENVLQWQKLVVQVNNQARAAVENILLEAGSLGNQLITDQLSEQIKIIGYFDQDQDLSVKIKEINSRITELKTFGLDPGRADLQLEQINETSWIHQWEKYYNIQHISRFLTIVPRWKDYQSKDSRETVLRLDPGKSFGTGMHPTTVLALHQLEFLLKPNARVFDVGAGSGVLSIAASLLGSGEVVAFENDPEAVLAAKKNLALNPMAQKVSFHQSNLLAAADGKADLMLANILPEVLVQLIPTVGNYLVHNGRFILSGINSAKEKLIVDLLAANGFVIESSSQMQDWCALVAKFEQD